MGRALKVVSKCEDSKRRKQVPTRYGVGKAPKTQRLSSRRLLSKANANAHPLGPTYKRRVLEINLLRLIGVQIGTFGPDVVFPPINTNFQYGLVDASGCRVAVLNDPVEKNSVSSQEHAFCSRMLRKLVTLETLHTQTIYTDGSFYRGRQLSGYAVWWGENHRNNACGPVPTEGPLSSAKAEEYAIFLALLQIKAEILVCTSRRPFEILTDALWVKNDILRWYRKWSKPYSSVGWKTPPSASTEHREILRVAAGLLWDIRSRGVNVTLKYIKGHTGVVGNELADLMAKFGSQTGRFIGPQPAVL